MLFDRWHPLYLDQTWTHCIGYISKDCTICNLYSDQWYRLLFLYNLVKHKMIRKVLLSHVVLLEQRKPLYNPSQRIVAHLKHTEFTKLNTNQWKVPCVWNIKLNVRGLMCQQCAVVFPNITTRWLLFSLPVLIWSLKLLFEPTSLTFTQQFT